MRSQGEVLTKKLKEVLALVSNDEPLINAPFIKVLSEELGIELPEEIKCSFDSYAKINITSRVINKRLSEINILAIDRHLADLIALRNDAEYQRQIGSALTVEIITEAISDAVHQETNFARHGLRDLTIQAEVATADVPNLSQYKDMLDITKNAADAAILFRQALRKGKGSSYNLITQYEKARQRYLTALEVALVKACAIRLTLKASFGISLPLPLPSSWFSSDPDKQVDLDPIPAISDFIKEVQRNTESSITRQKVHTLFGMAYNGDNKGDTLIQSADFVNFRAKLKGDFGSEYHEVKFRLDPILIRHNDLKKRIEDGTSFLRLVGITASPVLEPINWPGSRDNYDNWKDVVSAWTRAVMACDIRLSITVPKTTIQLENEIEFGKSATMQEQTLIIENQKAILPAANARLDDLLFPVADLVMNKPLSAKDIAEFEWKLTIPARCVNSARGAGLPFNSLTNIASLLEPADQLYLPPHDKDGNLYPIDEYQSVEFTNIAIIAIVAEVAAPETEVKFS